jgi:hypothetical protein
VEVITTTEEVINEGEDGVVGEGNGGGRPPSYASDGEMVV